MSSRASNFCKEYRYLDNAVMFEALWQVTVPDRSNRKINTERVLGAFQLAFLWRSPNIQERKIERVLKEISECEERRRAF